MSANQPQYRHSWKKPWAFSSFYEMRKVLTEREVYKKLKLLERHSSYKKPYWNFETHPHGELHYSWPGYPPGDGTGPWVPPTGPGPDYGGCVMACHGGILDCEAGGCDDITCICGIAPYVVTILEDPTGEAWAESGINPRVCIPDGITLTEEYPVIYAEVLDYKSQSYVVEFPLVDCKACCDEFTLSGDTTVNPSATWTGTIDPPCPGATCEVSSNSGCTLTCAVNASGSEVAVSIGANDCGTFTVTITEPTGCADNTATIVVRINNTGQGGVWAKQGTSGNCAQAGCGCGSGGTIAPCIDDDTGLKYGTGSSPNFCTGNINISCAEATWYNGSPGACPTPACWSVVNNCIGNKCAGSGNPCETMLMNYTICEWSCSC